MKKIGYFRQAGRIIDVYEEGDIHYLAPFRENPSKEWIWKGAWIKNNFGHNMFFFTPEGLLDDDIDWQYKNGKQRLFVVDIDHGTTRNWTGNHSFVRGE
jgi:hypothetical protein